MPLIHTDPAIGYVPRRREKYGWCAIGKHYVSLSEVRTFQLTGREICTFHSYPIEKSTISST